MGVEVEVEVEVEVCGMANMIVGESEIKAEARMIAAAIAGGSGLPP
jgi:hypothetical protein